VRAIEIAMPNAVPRQQPIDEDNAEGILMGVQHRFDPLGQGLVVGQACSYGLEALRVLIDESSAAAKASVHIKRLR
jgi:hypothetical protein